MTVKYERFHTKGHLHQMALSIRYRGAELGQKGEQVATPQLFFATKYSIQYLWGINIIV